MRGLAAYRELLATRPEWHGRVVHLAFAYPSRSPCRSTAPTPSGCSRARGGDHRGVRHAGLESADPRGQGRLPPVARRLRGRRRAAGEPDQGRHEPGRAGGAGPVRTRLRAGAVPRGGRRRDPGRRRAAGQPVRRQRDRRGPAPGAGHAGRRTPPPRPRRWPPPPRPARPPAGSATSWPHWTGTGRAPPLAGPASPAAIATSSATIPSGPSTTRSASAATGKDSALALATAQPGMPFARRARTAAKAGRSPRSSPQNMTASAARSRVRPVSAAPLSMPGGRSSMTIRPGSAASPSRAARSPSGSRSSRQRRFRVGRAAGVHGQRVPLVLDPGAVGGARRCEHAGITWRAACTAGRGVRPGQLTVLPALPAVVTEHDQAGNGVEPAVGDRLRGGPAGDDRERADRPGQPPQRGHRPGVGARRLGVGHDRRQRAVEVRGDQRLTRAAEQRVQPGLPLGGDRPRQARHADRPRGNGRAAAGRAGRAGA